jgi:nucleotide-binding universal stress UspA family protein
MRTFIVPTDFSTNARFASEYGIQLASQLNARMVLMHCYETPSAVSEYELSTIHFDNMKEYLRKRLDERKEELYNKFGRQVSVECIAYDNDLIGHIQKVCNQKESNLVIIGLTGAGMAHIFVGSNTVNIVNNSGHAVITVPPRAVFKPIKKIVFACDLKKVSESVPAEKIKRALLLLGAELLVLNIRHPKNTVSTELEEEKEKLSKMLSGVTLSFHTVVKKNIIAGIKDFVKKQHADLILIIPRKHDTIDLILKASHTKAMLFRSSVPILTIPVEQNE